MANTLFRLGHKVKILTSDRSLFNKTRYSEIKNDKYEIKRITKVLRIVDTIFPFQNIKKYICDFNADFVFLIHVNHGLPYLSIKYLKPKTKVVSFFGDLNRQHRSCKRKITTYLIKDRWYYETFLRSNLIVANTNETKEILIVKSKGYTNVKNKIYRSSLGFDSDKFYYKPSLRVEFRKRYGFLDNQIVLCTTTKIVKRKPIIEWIYPIITLLKKNHNIVYCLSGFIGDKYSELIKRKIKKLYVGDNLLLIDYLSYEQLNCLFNGADYSIWFDASITIQESMATGLKAIIPNSKRVDHLIDGKNGFIYKDQMELIKPIKDLSPFYDRAEIAKYNSKYSYESIINEILYKSEFKD